MKIIQDEHWHSRKREVSISDAIEGTINYTGENSGIAEMGNEKADNAGKILGKLIECLHKRHMLTDDEIADMLGYRYTVEGH